MDMSYRCAADSIAFLAALSFFSSESESEAGASSAVVRRIQQAAGIAARAAASREEVLQQQLSASELGRQQALAATGELQARIEALEAEMECSCAEKRALAASNPEGAQARSAVASPGVADSAARRTAGAMACSRRAPVPEDRRACRRQREIGKPP